MFFSVCRIVCITGLEWGPPTQIQPSCRNVCRNGSIYLFYAPGSSAGLPLHVQSSQLGSGFPLQQVESNKTVRGGK